MKIYVAARFPEKEMVRGVYAQLKEMGHSISADWTLHKNAKPYDEHPELAGTYAEEDASGVIGCDAFILFTSPEAGSGVSAELGAAIATQQLTGKPRIYVVGQNLHTNAFFFHPAITRVDNVKEVLAELA